MMRPPIVTNALCYVYIFCLFHTLSAPLWFHFKPIFTCPAIQAKFESKQNLFTSQLQRRWRSIEELRFLFSPLDLQNIFFAFSDHFAVWSIWKLFYFMLTECN